MGSEHQISELFALLDRLEQPADSPEVLRQLQAELELWFARHDSELPRQV